MIIKKRYLAALAAASVLLTYCAPTQMVKPLYKGENQVTAHFGGPLIKFSGAPIPLPFASVHYARGLTDKTTAFGGIGLTQAAFGVVQVDLGVTQGILTPKGARPGFSVTPDLFLMYDVWQKNIRVYPTLDANAYWDIGKQKSTAYVGITNWFELNGKRAFDEPQPDAWLQGFHAGYVLRHNSWNFTLQTSFLAPFKDNVKLVPEYISFGKTGAIGVYLGVGKTFGAVQSKARM